MTADAPVGPITEADLAQKNSREKRDVQAMSLRVPRDLYETVKNVAYATDTSLNEFIVRGLAEYVAQEEHLEALDALSRRVQEQARVGLDKLRR